MAVRFAALPLDGVAGGPQAWVEVARVLEGVPGVVWVYVLPALETAFVEYDPAACRPERLVEALAEAGYRARSPLVR